MESDKNESKEGIHIGYLFSNIDIFPDKSSKFLFYTSQNVEKTDQQLNELQIVSSNSNPCLIKFRYNKENSKYFFIYDQSKKLYQSCPINSFASHFVCYVSKSGKPKVHPKNKKRFNWIKIDLTNQDSIQDVFDLAFLPHQFNNFYQNFQNLKQINSFTEEFTSIILQFRPNGHFLNTNKYFGFTIEFLLFFSSLSHSDEDNDEMQILSDERKKILNSFLLNSFVDIIVNEFFEMDQYFELAAVSFCQKERRIVPPLEMTHYPKFNLENAKKLCDTVIIFYGHLFLLWVFNANLDDNIFISLYEKWITTSNKKFDVEQIFEIVIQKLESGDFSNCSLRKYLEFVNLFIQKVQLDDVRKYLLDNQSKFSKSVFKQINIILLNSNDNQQDIKHQIARIDQKDLDYPNDNNNNNDNNATKEDQSYVTHVNEHRGLWFNSIPNSFLYERKKDPKNDDTTVYTPPFTFRLFKPPQTKQLTGKRISSNRPSIGVINNFQSKSSERKYKSTRPAHSPTVPT